MYRLNKLFILLACTLMVSCYPAKQMAGGKNPRVRNVILFIGDGMGIPAVYAAMSASQAPLNLERFPVTGFLTTYSANAYITDSGAAGTALATGSKTKNGAIGVDENGTPVYSVLSKAEQAGLATGVVATSSVTHATPASFIAHQSSRGSYEDIAKDFLKTDVDVFIGGGYDHFGNRSDKVSLIDSLKAKGYEIATDLTMIARSQSDKLAGLTYPVQPPYRLKGRGDMLATSTGKAIEILSKNRKGFFMMVEGSQIDWAAHANAADTLIDETLDLDKAVGLALDFAEKNKNTLVILTADHETGGVTITGGDMKTGDVKLSFSTKDHTAVMVPVFAYGPGALNFTGVYDNTELPKKILGIFRFTQKKK